MGSSAGPTTTMTNQPPAWYSNAAQGYLGRAGEVAGQDYTRYDGQRIADLSPVTRGAIGGLWDMANGHPMGDDAVNMTRNTLQGKYKNPFADSKTGDIGSERNKYAGENPYFMQQLGRGQEKITDAYNKGAAADTARMFALSGAFGGSAHQNAVKNNQEVLGQQLGDFTNSMLSDQYTRSAGLEESYLGRDFDGQKFNAGLNENSINRGFQGHESERGRQMQGVGAATNLLDTHSNNLMRAMQAGDIERGHMQSLLDSNYGDFREWRDFDRNQLDIYGNALSRAAGGAGSTQTSQGPGPDRVSQGLGAMAAANFLTRGAGGK
jgi:hypothetical protein